MAGGLGVVGGAGDGEWEDEDLGGGSVRLSKISTLCWIITRISNPAIIIIHIRIWKRNRHQYRPRPGHHIIITPQRGVGCRTSEAILQGLLIPYQCKRLKITMSITAAITPAPIDKIIPINHPCVCLNAQLNDFPMFPFANGFENTKEFLFHLGWSKHVSSVFGSPHQMVLQVVETV